ncbi:MAG TPA: Hpt domain-containing protein [Candidatus Elarobacter sp.]|jgi:HPt (histidine-containing phosphotransfer) domain-containing protein
MTEERILDRVRLRAICRDDAALMRDVLETLVAEADDLLGELHVAVTTQDGSSASGPVAALEGIARNVGAHELRLVTHDVEAAIAENNWDAVRTGMESLERAVERLRRSAGELD